MKLVNCEYLIDSTKTLIRRKLADDKFKSITKPRVVFIKVGDYNTDLIEKECHDFGINFNVYDYKENVSTEHLAGVINRLSLKPTVTGIMVQHDLPDHINRLKLIDEIDPIKDIEGSTLVQAGMLQLGIQDKNRLVPYIPKAIVRLLDYIVKCEYEKAIELKGKFITVIGSCDNMLISIARLLQEENAIITLCHSKTYPIPSMEDADIIILATNTTKYFKSRYFYGKSKKKIIIDLDNNLDFEDVNSLNNSTNFLYCPFNNGLEELSILALLDNICIAYNNQFDFIWKYLQNFQISEAELNKVEYKTEFSKLDENRIYLDIHKNSDFQYFNMEKLLEQIDMNKKNILVFPDDMTSISLLSIEKIIKLLPIERKDFFKYFSIEGNDNIKHKFLNALHLGSRD